MGNKKKDYEPHPNEAWSYANAKIPPPEWQEVRNGVTYFFFHDDMGDLFYQTDSGIRIAEEMEAAERKHKKKERC